LKNIVLKLDSERRTARTVDIVNMKVWIFVYVYPEASFEFKKMYRAKIHTDHLLQRELAYFVHGQNQIHMSELRFR
jgi:hypothetical protein